MAELGPKLPPLRTTVTSPAQDEGPAAVAPAAPVPAKSPWVLGLCSVIFDVDKGQTLQDLWPPDCLSEEDKAAVAFHAFPDSLSMELYTRNAIRDSSFTFRIKREPETLEEAGMPEFLCGYVFCRQRQDESMRRGGEQVSVLVLAATPFSGALLPLSQAAGHAFFNEGPLALTLVYNKVLSWPPPIPGGSMCLPIGAGVINVRLPHFCIIPPPQPTVDPSVQASLPRRMSRSMSRKASGSPRIAAAARSGSSAASTGSGELASMLGAAAAADAAAAAAGGGAAAAAPEESEWALVPGASQQQQQQQQQPEPGMSSRGSASSLSGLRVSSRSRLSRPDLTRASSGSGTNLAAVGAADGSSNGVLAGSSSGDWPSSSLGQQWRDEKPFPEVEPALVLAPLLRDLWTLWQLVVTGQPLLVVGLHPGETTAAVAALVSLIAPLPYAADFRPYFTIHDPDFVALASGQLPQRTRYHELLPPKPQPQQQGQQQPEQQEGQGAASCEPEHAKQQDVQQQQQPGAAGVAAGLGGSGQQEPGDATVQQQQQQQGSQEQGCPQQHQHQQHRPAAAAARKKQQFHLPALIGITNLYFIKALPKWPNVVAVSKKGIVAPSPGGASSSRSGSPAKPVPGTAAAAANGAAADTAAGSPSAAAAGPTHVRSGSGSGSGPAGFFSSTAAAAMRALQRRHQGPQHLLSHFAPHLWTTRHTQCVKPDHALLSKARAAIEPAVGSSGGAGTAAGSSSGSSGGSSSVSVVGVNSAAGTAAARLRRHFAELTVALLAPFEVYFTTGPTGKVPAWRPEAFLASLDPSTLSPVLTARLAGSAATSAAALYAAFVESPNFAFWFKQRRAPVLHLVEDEPESDDEDGFSKVAAGGGDSSDAGVQSDPDEVELVQQLLSTEQELTDWQQLGRAQKAGAMPRGWQQQEQMLQLQVVQTFLQLPRDMQTVLFSSPARQAQLQEAAAVLAAGSSGDQAAAAAVLHKMQELLISTTGEVAEAPAS